MTAPTNRQQRTAPPQHDNREREKGRVALKAFFNITEAWGCSPEEQRILLGGIGKTTYYKYRALPAVLLPQDTLERISYVMGIYKALRILLPTEEQANAWVRRPNQAPLFNGQSALQRMLAGRVVDLADVRRYLDAWRG
ncbi:MAG TPA: MbcA/ParS/Xre antitoxin family protein [Candidatus Competibacteraceae bacterium]|nr:MbcA/ParS/Xre antitoxin family protein [Candidatus Competibacteraceae bacterium]